MMLGDLCVREIDVDSDEMDAFGHWDEAFVGKVAAMSSKATLRFRK